MPAGHKHNIHAEHTNITGFTCGFIYEYRNMEDIDKYLYFQST